MHPPLPEPHRVAYPLWIDGRALASCNCHWMTPLTAKGEIPRRAHLKSVS